jgi:ABC-type transport system involved in cytochrome bd biosynthesis fused ATPase/permease subunit
VSTDPSIAGQDRSEADISAAIQAEGPPPLVVAEGLSLAAKQGPVFTDLRFNWPKSTLVAVVGPSGSGRSSLLLALVGRLRGVTGRLSVTGLDAIRESRKVAQQTSVAGSPTWSSSRDSSESPSASPSAR